MLAVFVAIAAGVWFYREKMNKVRLPAPVASPRHAIEILHFHLPNHPASEQLADHLNFLETKYTGQVLVTRIDATAHPERVKAEKVTQPPEVIILAGSTPALRFQGLWPRAQIESRVEEILRGLRRMEKGWTPPGVSRR